MYHVLEIRNNRAITFHSYDTWERAFDRAVELSLKFGAIDEKAVRQGLAGSMIYFVGGESPVTIQLLH